MTGPLPIDETILLKRTPDVLDAPVEDRMLILSVESGSYFDFSPVTGRIWQLLEVPRSVTDLVGLLLAEYDVEAEVCRAEVRHVMDELVKAGLVQAA